MIPYGGNHPGFPAPMREGTIKRGPFPASNRFVPPNAGVQPSLQGPTAPMFGTRPGEWIDLSKTLARQSKVAANVWSRSPSPSLASPVRSRTAPAPTAPKSPGLVSRGLGRAGNAMVGGATRVASVIKKQSSASKGDAPSMSDVMSGAPVPPEYAESVFEEMSTASRGKEAKATIVGAFKGRRRGTTRPDFVEPTEPAGGWGSVRWGNIDDDL